MFRTYFKRNNLWVLVVCLIISMIIAGFFYQVQEAQKQKSTKLISTIYTNRMENLVDNVFHKTDVLAAVVKLKNGNITKETFDNIAKTVYKKNEGIRGIQYMPKAVVTYSYPLKGNEAVMGKDFFKIPERRNDVLLAIRTKSIALSGPYHLIQGGIGVVARNPVFLKDKHGKTYFWGFSAIILDLPQALDAAGLDNLSKLGYDYSLSSTNENNERIVIDGKKDLASSFSITTKVKVPHHYWTLTVRSKKPYITTYNTLMLCVFTFFLSIIIWRLYCLMVKEREAVKVENQFFSDISHDMRTPLNAIIGFSALAQEKGVTSKQKGIYLEKIQDSGKMLLDLVNDTLTMSKMSNGKLVLHKEPVHTLYLLETIMSPIQMIADEKNISIILDDREFTHGTIMADQLNVTKIFLNMLSNAVKFTPTHGHIWVTLKDINKQEAMITIKDDGIGMSTEFLPHIFEPFAQERRKGYESLGTGLGLAITKNLVGLMGGHMEVESVISQGTTFTIHLPYEYCAFTKAPEKTIYDPAILKEKTVLLCEDNTLNREIATTLLEHAGMKVIPAEDGSVALEMFLHSEAHAYDLILMDIRMPVMNGYECAKAIRGSHKADARTIPIIALTADVFSGDREKCYEVGMNGHITKPINPDHLYQVMAKHLS